MPPNRQEIEFRIADHIGSHPTATVEEVVRATLDRLSLEDCLVLAEEQASKTTHPELLTIHRDITRTLDRLEVWVIRHA